MDDVVVGDKVLLQSGDKVPADGVLIHGTLRVDNSALNGEAEECPKTAADESFPLPEDITGDTFVDAHSLFRGAVLFDGEGVLDVRKVGLATMMGKMAEEMQDDEPDSPLKVKLGKLADMISPLRLHRRRGYRHHVLWLLYPLRRRVCGVLLLRSPSHHPGHRGGCVPGGGHHRVRRAGRGCP